jgi:squalene synthase HpnC
MTEGAGQDMPAGVDAVSATVAGPAGGFAAARNPGQTASSAGSGEQIAAAMAQRSGGENFPVAMRALPARYRQHLMAVYGFARTVDDIGDRADPAERAGLLADLESDLDRLYGGPGEPRLAVIQALAPAVSSAQIPEQPFLDLIEANRQDQVVSRYPVFADLKAYCVLSANPVGRIVLYVFGEFTLARAELSDLVCTGLQLVEHWQDVGEDYRAGRIYLPGADLARYGCTEADLAAPRAGGPLRSLIAFECQRARAMLDAGAPLVGQLGGFPRLAVAGYVAGGRAALTAIARSGYDVLSATRSPGQATAAAQTLRTWATGR